MLVLFYHRGCIHLIDDLVPDIQIDNVVLGGAPRLLNFVQETPKLRVNTRRGTIF